jgi:hypothetical protein
LKARLGNWGHNIFMAKHHSGPIWFAFQCISELPFRFKNGLVTKMVMFYGPMYLLLAHIWGGYGSKSVGPWAQEAMIGLDSQEGYKGCALKTENLKPLHWFPSVKKGSQIQKCQVKVLWLWFTLWKLLNP